MEPKRERRPNVRLEELGDFPAAFACVISSPRGRWSRHPSAIWNGLPSEEADPKKPPQFDFGAITRKTRLANRRRGRTAMGNNRVFAGSWGIKYSPWISDEVRQAEEDSAEYASGSPSADPSRGTGLALHGVGNASNVGRWLEEIGFGMYARVFEMHEVDEEALPLLTIQDLKEMGLSAVGPRRKLYEMIRRVAGDPSPLRPVEDED